MSINIFLPTGDGVIIETHFAHARYLLTITELDSYTETHFDVGMFCHVATMTWARLHVGAPWLEGALMTHEDALTWGQYHVDMALHYRSLPFLQGLSYDWVALGLFSGRVDAWLLWYGFYYFLCFYFSLWARFWQYGSLLKGHWYRAVVFLNKAGHTLGNRLNAHRLSDLWYGWQVVQSFFRAPALDG